MPEVASEEPTTADLKQPLGAYSPLPQGEGEQPESTILSRVSSLGKETPPKVTITSSDTTQTNKPPRSAITGVLTPEETVFKLKATALEKQVADLTAQVEELINKIKDEKEAGKKAVLKATIESEGKAEKLQSLVQMQREELLNLKKSLEVESQNSQGKDVRIHELETALTENDSLLATLGNNSYFGQGSEDGAVTALDENAVDTSATLQAAKEETTKLLEQAEKNSNRSLELLRELLTELEETTDCGDIKKEIDDIAASISPEVPQTSLSGTVNSNSLPPETGEAHMTTNDQIKQVVAEDVVTTAKESVTSQITEKIATPEAPITTTENNTVAETLEILPQTTSEPAALETKEKNLTETPPSATETPQAESVENIATEHLKDENVTEMTQVSEISSPAAQTTEEAQAPVEEKYVDTPQETVPETAETVTPATSELNTQNKLETLQTASTQSEQAPIPEEKGSSPLLSKEAISALFAAAPIATPESYLVSPFGFLSKETAARDLTTFPENLISALSTKNPHTLIDEQLYATYKDTLASQIYLSSGSFSGTPVERVKMSAFIRSLLSFFMPNHIATLPDEEAKLILSSATVGALWQTTCELYDEEKSVANSSLSSLIMENLGLAAAAIEEKQATLREIVDTVYAKFLNPLLGKKVATDADDDTVSPILEALRKAFEMDEKELALNPQHNYQFFMIALKNFLLRENERKEIVKLFEEAREETLASLTESDAQKAEILRLFERAKEEARA